MYNFNLLIVIKIFNDTLYGIFNNNKKKIISTTIGQVC